MATVEKDGLFADMGANFFCADGKLVKRYAKELSIPYYTLSKKEEWYVIKDGLLTKSRSLTYVENWWESLKFVLRAFQHRTSVYDLNDSSGTTTTAKEASLLLGNSFHEYVTESHVRALMFYDSSFLPEQFLWSNMWQGIRYAFGKRRVLPHVADLPLALAKRVYVKHETVEKVAVQKNGVVVATNSSEELFDTTIIAAGIPSETISGAPDAAALLASVRYAPTIVAAYKIPAETLSFCSMIGVPFSENKIISIITNEGRKLTTQGEAIMGVALHEEAIAELGGMSDEAVDARLRKELALLIPQVQPLARTMPLFALKRWEGAIPKYPPAYVQKVQTFWREHQGKQNIYLTGDYMNHTFVEGAITSGLRVVELIKNKTSTN